MQQVAVVASTDIQPGEDAFKAVADLAKRKGQNAIRPDIIRVPISALGNIAPLAEELRRRSEEEDPAAGKSALALLVDAGEDYAGAAKIADGLSGIGGLSLRYQLREEPDWAAYEDCVKAAIDARVPLWVEATEGVLAWDNFLDTLGGNSFPGIDDLLEMARRAHTLGHRGLVLSLRIAETTPSYMVRAYRLLSTRLTEMGRKYPIHLLTSSGTFGAPLARSDDYNACLIGPSIDLGSLLCDGIGNSVEIGGEGTVDERVALAFNILQAAGARTVKAEFVACPSCGRTLFDLQETTDRIKKATGHLRGVKIAVMGCIVNGLGELADADFGYMGGAPGKVNLFVGKECVEKGVPTEQAVDRLIDIIHAHGKWVEPQVRD
jgi:4-hydroxy-3-methylbut-2-en-1-yl diphosphate synthase IspG/GcpE